MVADALLPRRNRQSATTIFTPLWCLLLCVRMDTLSTLNTKRYKILNLDIFLFKIKVFIHKCRIHRFTNTYENMVKNRGKVVWNGPIVSLQAVTQSMNGLHCGYSKKATILQMLISNAFSRIKIYQCWLIQISLKFDMAPNKRQAIIWTNGWWHS